MADKETDIQWALDLLAPDPDNQTVLGNYCGTILAGCAGFGSACFANWAGRRPVWSGLQKHIALPILFAGVGRFFEKRAQDQVNERDAVFRHYITLHPEDFPPPERKKFSEILRPWVPIR